MKANHGKCGWRAACLEATLRAGEVTGKVTKSRQVRRSRDRVDTIAAAPRRASPRLVLDHPGDDLVRIVLQLTIDLEHFDSMVRDQRHLLEEAARMGAFDDDKLRRESRRLSVGAEQIITSARGALEQLRSLSELSVPPPVGEARSRPVAYANDRNAIGPSRTPR